MAIPKTYTLAALSKRRTVVRRHYRTPEFRQTMMCPPNKLGGKSPTHISHALLPRSAFELEAMSMNEQFTRASQIVIDQHLRLPKSASTSVRTIGELKEQADLCFSDVPSKSNRYHAFSQKHFGRPYNDLIFELKNNLVRRFVGAFEGVLVIPAHCSSRSSLEREVLSLESWASDKIQAEMVAIANEGHVYAHWIAALLLTSERPLTDAAVEHLLAAHEGGFPHALLTLGDLMLVEGFFVDALQTALLALEGGATWADSLIDRITKFTTGMVVMDNGPVRPLMYALVHEAIEPEFHDLAMKHRPQWRKSTPEEQEREFMATLPGRMSHD